MARPRITSIIAKWLFGETVTSEQKAILRASLEAAPASGISPSAITGTAGTLSGDQSWQGENTFNGTVDFIGAGVVGFSPAYVTGTAMTLSGNQTISGTKTFGAFATSGTVVFGAGTTFSADTDAATSARTALGIPTYADITAANAALNAGDIYFDTALGKLRSATA